MKLSKYCPLILILLIGIVVGCSRERVIDEVFRWPTSGVPEADSLILEMERRNIAIDTPVKGYRDLEIRMCSLAQKYPNNKLVQSRTRFIQYILMDKTIVSDDSLHNFIAIEKTNLDSAVHTFDWHKWIAFEIEVESDMMKKYQKINDNILYFKKNGVLCEEARARVRLGNFMKDYSDSVQARAQYQQALEIFKKLGQLKNVFACQLNLANTVSRTESDSINLYLITDTNARKVGDLQIQVMQNYFINTGKAEYLDSALQITDNKAYFYDNEYIEEVPILLALKGSYYDQSKKEPLLAIEYIQRGFDSIKSESYPARYLQSMYQFLGAAYGNAGHHDTAAFYFYQSIACRDSLNKRLQQTRVSGLDTKNRIELAEQNIRQQRDFWIWGLIGVVILLILCALIIVINHKRRQAVREYQQILVEQKLQKSMQSVQIQTMVIDENEKFIDELSNQINALRRNGEIDMASAGVLTRIMKLHKNDREAHKELLKTRQDLDNDFMNKLKEDYPGLTEGQLKLASLIAIGTESPQICRILGIQLSSLHKSRYRLRTRLGLKNDESLEEFLRKRNKATV